jgi:gliding motility-associated-like protein
MLLMKRVLLFALTILLFSKGVIAQPGANLPSPNLDAWYPFCSDTTDHNVIGYDLFNSGLTLTTDRFNNKNSAYLFNGASSQLHYSTFFSMAGAFTYGCWIYPTTAQRSVIIYNGSLAANGMGVEMDDGNPALAPGAGSNVSLYVGGVGVPTGTSGGAVSVAVTLNQWHHVVFVRSGNAYILYVDQTFIGAYIPVTTPAFPGFFAPTNVFQVGCSYNAAAPGTSNMFFSGKIDDIAVYSKLLTYPTEITKLHNYNPDVVVDLGPDTAYCADSVLLPVDGSTGMYPFPYYNWRWDTAVGIGAVTFDTASSFATEAHWVHPSKTGTKYIIEVTRPLITLPYGNTGNSCIGRDTVTLRHIAVKIELGNDTTFCRGNHLTLNWPAAMNERYLWSTFETTDSIRVTTSGKYFVRADSIIHISASDSVVCYGTDTINIHVPDSIHVHLGPNDTLCAGGTDTLFSLDTLTYGNPHYLWGGPPNVGGSTTSVVVATVTGTYWLQVEDSSCYAADTITAVIVFDTVNVYNSDTSICAGMHIITSASFDPNISYQWRPTAGMPSSSNPATTITPDTSAEYVLTATISGCSAQDSFFIDVQPYPYVYAGGNRSVCTHDTIRIIPTISPSWYTHYTYDWTPGNYLNDSSEANVIFTPGDTTKLILVVSTPRGCSGVDSAMIFVHLGDFSDVNVVSPLCPGDSAQFLPTSIETVPITYRWHPGTNLNDSTIADPWVKPIVSTDYYGIATSQYGCKDTLNMHITVHPAAVITLADSFTMYAGESYNINAQTNATSVSWTPPLGLDDTSISNPIATPAVNTKYIISARTEFNCIAKDSILIRIDQGSFMTAPNAFTPGGNYNSTFKVIMKGLARLRSLRIYNRWGGLMYETSDLSAGWDGTLSGKPQPMGVYVYEIEAVTDQGVVLKKHGNITLLR